MMQASTPDEQLVVPCCECGVPVLTWLDPNGYGMLRGEYILVADWIFHPRCWDKLVAEHPIDGEGSFHSEVKP